MFFNSLKGAGFMPEVVSSQPLVEGGPLNRSPATPLDHLLQIVGGDALGLFGPRGSGYVFLHEGTSQIVHPPDGGATGQIPAQLDPARLDVGYERMKNYPGQSVHLEMLQRIDPLSTETQKVVPGHEGQEDELGEAAGIGLDPA